MGSGGTWLEKSLQSSDAKDKRKRSWVCLVGEESLQVWWEGLRWRPAAGKHQRALFREVIGVIPELTLCLFIHKHLFVFEHVIFFVCGPRIKFCALLKGLSP